MGVSDRIPSGERPASERTTSRRAALVLAAAVALVAGLAACGNHDQRAGDARRTTTTTRIAGTEPAAVSTTTVTTPARTVAPTTTTTVARAVSPPVTLSPVATEQAAFRRLLLTLPAHAYATSAIYRTGTTVYAIVAHDLTSLTSVIDVELYRNGSFTPVAANIGLHQNLDPVALSTIQSANITGSYFPDFLVLLASGDHDNGVVLSFAGGSWHLLGNEDRTGAAASVELVQPQLVGNGVTQAVDDCNPTCATGTYSVTLYQFDPSTGELAASGAPTQQSRP